MTLLLLILAGSAPSWPDTVPVLDLTFDPESWQFACEHWEEDIPVEAVLISEGVEYPCLFRIRGATSRSYPKKSIKVVLDGGATVFGQSELNLNAEYLDRTRIRECLSYLFYARTGQTVPEVHLTELRFNGESQGAYLSVQDVDGTFLATTPIPDDAVIYKCADRYATLDSVTDLSPYEKKTAEDEPWDDLLLLIHWLTLVPDDLFERGLPARFHSEDLATCIAVNVLLGHGSTYYHNYHLVLDRSGALGPWRIIPWDMDRTWGSYGADLPYTRNSSNEGLRRNPLVWRMWCSDSLRAVLTGEIRRLAPDLQVFASSGIIDSLAAITRPLVEIDPFRDFTMAEFDADLEDVAAWPGERMTELEIMFASWPEPIRILPPEWTEEGLLVRWQDAGPGVTYTLMVSSDTTFGDASGLIMQASTADTSVVIPAEFCPEGSWMDVFLSTGAGTFRSENGPLPPEETPEASFGFDMVIHEIHYLCGPEIPAGDWLELVNTGADTMNLAGWAIRDANDEHLMTFPETLVPPGSFVVIPSDRRAFLTMHPGVPVLSCTLSHGLSDGGDQIRLWDLSGILTDYVAYLPASPWPWEPAGHGPSLSLIDPSLPNSFGSSWAAGPVGGTPGFPNDSLSGEWEPSPVQAWGPRPNPADQGFVMVLDCTLPGLVELGIYDLAGRVAAAPRTEQIAEGVTSLQFDSSALRTGLYFIVVRSGGASASFPLVVMRTHP